MAMGFRVGREGGEGLQSLRDLDLNFSNPPRPGSPL